VASAELEMKWIFWKLLIFMSSMSSMSNRKIEFLMGITKLPLGFSWSNFLSMLANLLTNNSLLLSLLDRGMGPVVPPSFIEASALPPSGMFSLPTSKFLSVLPATASSGVLF
jgi:hypothetical protein